MADTTLPATDSSAGINRQRRPRWRPNAEPGERWKRSKTWPWLWASSKGRIASEGPKHTHRPTIVGAINKANGRLAIRVEANKTAMAARVICDAWHGRPFWGAFACHNNGDHTDNRPENLRWDTPSANYADSIRHGKRPPGAINARLDGTTTIPANAKLTPATVIGLLLTMRTGETDTNAARRLGLSQPAIHYARTGKTWAHVAPCLPRRQHWKQR